MVTTPALYKGLQLASWNVRSLYRPGAAQTVVDAVKRHATEITAIQEVRWPGDGEITIDGYTIFYSGRNEQNYTGGTAFIVSPRARKSVLNFTPVNDRISVLRIKGRWFNISIINVYAPTEDKDDEVKDDFYENLEHAYDGIQRYDVKIVMGDFNAKIGKEPQFRPTIGAHSLHDTSSNNGIRCISFAAAKNLVISSTMFPHKDIHKHTWISPGDRWKNQIDHVLIDKRHRSSIQDVRSFRGADCDSDHSLVRIKFNQRLKRCHKTESELKRIRFEVQRLKEPEIQSQFRIDLANRFESLDSESTPIDEHWAQIEKAMADAALNVIGIQERRQPKKWFTEECRKAVEERRKLKILSLGKGDRESRDKYEAAQKAVNKALRKAKREFLSQRLQDIEDHGQNGRVCEFYADIRKERTGYVGRSTQMKRKDGRLTAVKEEVLGVWKEHFEQLLNSGEPSDDDDMDHTEDLDGDKVEEPDLLDVQMAIERIKRRKAPGVDSLPGELFKEGGETLTGQIHQLILKIWREEKIPDRWNMGLICPILKKGSVYECGNYRGIALLPVAYKILTYIMLNRMNPYYERALGDYQAGFRRGRSTSDQIFILKQILEKRWEVEQDVHALFIDFKAAYDSVDRSCLWKIMTELGFPGKLVRLTRACINGSRCRVLVQGEATDAFDVKSGLRQGDCLSPMLFNIALEKVIQECSREKGGVHVGKMHKFLAYADDVTVLGSKKEDIQALASSLISAASEIGLQVSQEKTKYMIVSRSLHLVDSLSVGDLSFPKVENFKYLGAAVTSINDQFTEVDQRITSANRAFFSVSRILRSRKVSRALKLRVYNTIIKPVLMYGCETWALTGTLEAKIERFERKVLRAIVGPKWDNDLGLWRRKTKEEIIAETRQSISHDMKAKRLRWAGHVARSNPRGSLYKTMNATVVGSRPRGRPRLRWVDRIKKDATEFHVVDWKAIAQDRQRWRRLVEAAKDLQGL